MILINIVSWNTLMWFAKLMFNKCKHNRCTKGAAIYPKWDPEHIKL